MTSILEYNEARERWTWQKQVMHDGSTKILSPLRVQDDDGCCYFALVTTLESNLRVQLQRSISLSIPHLRKLDEISRTKLPTVAGKLKRLLLMVQDVGIFEEAQYEDILQGTLREADAQRYRVLKFSAYNLNNLEDIKFSLYHLRSRGPLLAVIRISENYHDCRNSGLIYRFDPNRPVQRKDPGDKIMTHAVSVVSFAVEAKVPCLECQDSRGPRFARNGFLVVDITSVVELYSIKV